MYSVVGCSECSALNIVEGRPETTQCPRCGKRRQFGKLKQFVQTEDRDHAREVRSSMLANKQGYGDEFAEIDSFADLEANVEDPIISDEEYLEGSGIDTAEVDAAGERAEAGVGGSKSRKETVLTALRELDAPSEDDVLEYTRERGVPDDYVRNALEKLKRRGEVSESRGEYRLL